MVRRTLLLVGLLGCYRPRSDATCLATCSLDNASCPDNMACGADLRCHLADEPDCGDATLPVSIDAPTCYGTGLAKFVAICDPLIPRATLTLAAMVLDTSDDASCDEIHTQDDGTTVCVLIATDIDVAGAFRATGARPLALIATHALTVDAAGSIDVASHVGQTATGAAASGASCVTSPGAFNSLSGSGSGGGAGGGFGGGGGAGGDGERSKALGGAVTTNLPVPQTLRGGCPGSRGGGGSALNGGASGGAIYVIAGAQIDVEGSIGASGAGAAVGSAVDEGGGGGGSGGMAILEAPMIAIEGSILASGGGGSGGGSTNPGSDPTPATAMTGATGGTSASCNFSSNGNQGAGGNGSTIATIAGANATNASGLSVTCSGGGGGGGAGVVRLFAPSPTVATGAVISPPPS